MYYRTDTKKSIFPTYHHEGTVVGEKDVTRVQRNVGVRHTLDVFEVLEVNDMNTGMILFVDIIIIHMILVVDCLVTYFTVHFVHIMNRR